VRLAIKPLAGSQQVLIIIRSRQAVVQLVITILNKLANPLSIYKVAILVINAIKLQLGFQQAVLTM
jgi:hypothetical protein